MICKELKRVAVGISGGVDSAVAAFLLKRKGYDVIGVFMKNWDLIDETGVCSVEKDFCDAQEVCSSLQIPFYEANFVKEYWTKVFEELVCDYRAGWTPNPDILCNKNIKFNYFIDFAINKLGADGIATGHYARSIICQDIKPLSAKLLKARDPIKDQTFFLSQISQFSLCRTIFPLGNLFKSNVKKIAIENNLCKFAQKKESMGICFIGRRNFQDFISEYIAPSEGNFIDIDSGSIVGKHRGKHNWTIGQRCRIGGSKKRYYVAFKTSSEDILVALGHNHPALFTDSLTTEEPFWIHTEPNDLKYAGILKCEFRFQHGKPLVNCLLYKLGSNKLLVKLSHTLRALTPGQYAVFYKGEECLGSARILHTGPSQYSLNFSKN